MKLILSVLVGLVIYELLKKKGWLSKVGKIYPPIMPPIKQQDID